MTATASQYEAANADYRARTTDEKLAIWKKILAGKRFEQVRDFLIVKGGPVPTVRSSVIHLPTGLWRGFDLSYQEAVRRLRENPQQDPELIHVLFEVA